MNSDGEFNKPVQRPASQPVRSARPPLNGTKKFVVPDSVKKHIKPPLVVVDLFCGFFLFEELKFVE